MRIALLATLLLLPALPIAADGPTAVDWRAHLGPARNQSLTGLGCFAFAETAVCEAQASIETGRRVTLAEGAEACPAAHREPVTKTIGALRAALQHGPVYATLRMHSDWANYRGGVYELATGAWPVGFHSVALVGYQDVPGRWGGGWFIARNAAGPAWGEDGYIRIGYSQVVGQVELGVGAYRVWGIEAAPPADVWHFPLVGKFGAVGRS